MAPHPIAVPDDPLGLPDLGHAEARALRKGGVLVMDNLSAHTGPAVIEATWAAGASLLYPRNREPEASGRILI